LRKHLEDGEIQGTGKGRKKSFLPFPILPFPQRNEGKDVYKIRFFEIAEYRLQKGLINDEKI
jgi:hypothetical protein